jgi:hypothetical protein
MKAIEHRLRISDKIWLGGFTRNLIKFILLLSIRHSYKYFVRYIHSRDELPYILNGLNLLGEGAEIGVKSGIFSEYLLTVWQGQKLHSIDPWIEFPENEYIDSANVNEDHQEEFYKQTCNRLRRFDLRSEILRTTSAEAARQFVTGQLDFVYIDAQHHYNAVKEDLMLWYPKVKKGGILSGHDYIDGKRIHGEFGVKSAVNEFATSNGLKVLSSAESKWPSWFILL